MNTCMELFGIECGPGWKKLYEPLIAMCKEKGSVPVQIKEKYGGLRFYVDQGDDELYDAIDAAEEESLRTCENCGQPGKIRSGGWIRTLCDACVKPE